jgi:DNA-binding phage protein
MDDGWQIRYLRHVQQEAEKAGGSLSSVARDAGVSSTTLTRALKPGYKFVPKMRTLEAIRDATGIPFAPFQGGGSEVGVSELDEEPLVLVPVYDVEASAGPGLIPPDDEALSYRLELPAEFLRELTDSHPRFLQVIKVKGTSMLPTLKPSDLIMLDSAKRSLTFDGLFVINIDGAVLVKRIGRSSRAGHVMIISDSPEQLPFERAIGEVQVIGKVILRMVRE